MLNEFRVDIIVDDDIFVFQDTSLGFLLNFGEALMKNGITRAVNGLPED